MAGMVAQEYPPSTTAQFIERFNLWHEETALSSNSSSYKALYLDNNQKALRDSLYWWACERGWTFDKSTSAVAASLKDILKRNPSLREGLPAAPVAATPEIVLPDYFRGPSESKLPFKVNMDGWCRDLWKGGIEKVCADVGSVGANKEPVVSFDEQSQQFILGPGFKPNMHYPEYFWLLFSNGLELCFKALRRISFNGKLLLLCTSGRLNL
jgi:hypothetical protein